MTDEKPTWKDHAYTGAAMYGRFKTIMSAIVGVIIFLLMIGFSIPYVGKKTKYSKSVSARIIAITGNCYSRTGQE